MRIQLLAAAAAIAGLAGQGYAQDQKPSPNQQYDERPADLNLSHQGWNYEKRVVDIPMRDGVKLHTVILIPNGAKDAPILLTRTPYNAEGMTGGAGSSANLAEVLQHSDGPADVILKGGYIRVIQDVRGKYGSEGIYMMNPPPHGTDLNPTDTDDSTDTYDTIDWLVKNVPESNKKVGILGISYDGYLSLTATIDPHPALKVAVPMNPMVDGWRGDDWFHNGALRETNMTYIWEQEATKANSNPWFSTTYDDYDYYKRAGSAGAAAAQHNLDQIGFWKKISSHPAYDKFWQDQAMDRVLAKHPLKVPIMLVHGQWDQEDIYGAPAVWKALKPKDTDNDMLYMTMGPWYHGQEVRDGSALGNIDWDQDTAKWWRWHVLAPFLSHYLKGTPMDVAPVTVFRSGTNEWQELQDWPVAKANDPLYLKPGGGLGFDKAAGPMQTADYVSDPDHPVTYRPRPIPPVYASGSTWHQWLTDDQRFAESRPDVLTFTTDVLTKPVTIAGQPVVHLNASTSGTDSDWVVKLIDVYPDQVPAKPEMGGYEFPVAMDIFRGRYRESLSDPKSITPDKPLEYTFDLPNSDHVFLPGHRIMVQVQSSWFPLYDRNPQKYVKNIFYAKPEDFQKATQKVTVSGPNASYIDLPVVAN
ncbi:CocE/NonD family hydrolase [Stakelama sp. CBK3Z-3]|uniref:CocE/NonD family hydrolase n=1 Tax=Stakelama flava TaxID=2860338 RepID=A0ABS6XPQ1_9SPHN|nr:CocE/NonD family hydrolase [Stakelama flava]MBW4332202.1 CocE/NonD family hydrolase [Stakelama flava]